MEAKIGGPQTSVINILKPVVVGLFGHKTRCFVREHLALGVRGKRPKYPLHLCKSTWGRGLWAVQPLSAPNSLGVKASGCSLERSS